jgi:uncharacterized membrane protein
MAAVSELGRRTALALAALAVVGLACAEPRSTEPSIADPAYARGGGDTPTVTSAVPSEAPQNTTLEVRVLGSNYDQGSRVDFTRAGVVDPKLKVNSTAYVSNAELVANVSIAADAAPVSYDVMVTKSTGKKGIGTERFAVLVPVELLSAPAGGSHVRAVSDNGLVVGNVAGACGIGFDPALWDPSGQLTVLPALPGTCGGTASDVNSAGVAVGLYYIGSSSSGNVRWVPSGGTYQIQELPRLPDGSISGAGAINEAGWVAATNSSAVWTESTGWQMLQRPSGATSCLGSIGINNLGATVARCSVSGKGRAAYWASPTAAPTLLPLPTGTSDVFVNDINDAGVIVGRVSVSAGKNKFIWRATRWIPAGASWTVETLPDLGAGGGAWAINEAGQIAGHLDLQPGGPKPAFWNANGVLRQLEGRGEALGLSQAAAGPVVAGTIIGDAAARWRP